MKKYMFSVISLLFIAVMLLLPVNVFKKNIKIDYELEKERVKTYVYYVADKEVVGVPIYDISSNKYTQIKEVFMYLTQKSNYVNEKYETYLNLNTKLVSYEVLNDNIYLEVDNNFLKINENDTSLILGQILYTYQDLGFKNVFLKYNGNILTQVNSIPIYNGINNLAINVVYKSSNINTKTVKITYCYKDDSKGFINYIINSSDDNLDFILEDLIHFVNTEYDYNASLVSYKKTSNYINLKIKASEEEKEIIKKIINLNVKNVIYDFTYF